MDNPLRLDRLPAAEGLGFEEDCVVSGLPE
jgi:hypothetical protein